MARKKESKNQGQMNAIDLLESQHREVEKLFERFEAAEDEDGRRKIFESIADALAVHATIEERIFYPACLAAKTEDILLESVEEHLQIKRVLADLLEMEPGEERFEPAMKVLKEEVEHHVGEEQNDMFPKVRKLLDEERLLGLAGEMLALKAELEQGGEPRAAVPAETEEPAPLE